jgi:hypothetical protein
MARQLLKPSNRLHYIFRTTSQPLADEAERAGVALAQWSANLADPAPVARSLAA